MRCLSVLMLPDPLSRCSLQDSVEMRAAGQTHGAREEGSSDHHKKARDQENAHRESADLRLTSIASPNNDTWRLRARSTQPPGQACSTVSPP